MKATLQPLYFKQANEREMGEMAAQMDRLRELYGDVAEFLEPVAVGETLGKADAVVFPQLLGAAFREREALESIKMPMVVLTSEFGTVEMWDWEIVTYLRAKGCQVFSPYTVELGKTVLRAIGLRAGLAAQGAKVMMFQDDPGEGMQAYIFKRFYWWEKECSDGIEDASGIHIVYKSWKAVNEKARQVPDDVAREVSADWNIHQEGVSEENFLRAVKLYVAVKEEIQQEGGILAVGANCLNESFHSDTTPCLAWNMLFERDGILWVCEGDTVSMLSKLMIYNTVQAPIMMSNIYPFLMGMAALKHEKIDKFPEIEDPDNHALIVHCGYFGCVPRQFCDEWTLRPKVLEIVDDNALMIDGRMPVGPATLVKLHPEFNKLIIIRSEIEGYVQYPGSDCRNGCLIKYGDGHKVMNSLYSHHALLMTGDRAAALQQVAAVFGWEVDLM